MQKTDALICCRLLEGRSVTPFLLTILVVDDWPDAAESLGQLLGLYGHTILVAHDGSEAMEKARRCEPDVVLMEVALPKITGLDVARILSNQGDKKPLLIAVSGFCSKEDKATAFKAGFDHFVAKPMDPNDLLQILGLAAHFGIKRESAPVLDGLALIP